MKTLQLWKNGNRQVGVVQYGETSFKAESDVFDGVKWQTRVLGTYATAKNAERRIVKEMAAISTGWTAEPNWMQTI